MRAKATVIRGRDGGGAHFFLRRYRLQQIPTHGLSYTETERKPKGMSAVKTIALDQRRENATVATLLWCAAGLVIPRATLLGALSPFGMGLAACSGVGGPAFFCIAVGYLLASPTLLPLRYVAAVALMAGGRWVLAVIPDSGKQAFVPPLLAFTGAVAAGMTGLMGHGVDGYRVLLILTEAALAAGAALFFDKAMEVTRAPARPLSASGQAALIAAVAVTVSAVSTVEVSGFSPGRVVAALLVLLCAHVAREAGGCVAGCVLGGGLALTAPAATPIAVALTFGGLLAGVFSRFGRVVQALFFLLGALAVSLSSADANWLTLLYELFSAAVLFALLPPRWEQHLTRLLARRRDLPAAEGVRRMTALRLQVAGGAMEEVARSVEAVSQRLAHHGAADMASLYRGCATTVCVACPMRGVCWELKREDTLAGLESLTPLLQQASEVTAADLKELPMVCRRPAALADHLTRGYRDYLVREDAWRRLAEVRQAVEHQFDGTAALLEGLTKQLQDPHGVDLPLSAQVLGVCEDYGMPVEEALCTRDPHGRLTVSLLVGDDTLPEGKWRKRLEQVCGCALGDPAVAVWGERTRVTLTEPPRYRVERGVAQRTCAGETLCGDTVQTADLCGGALTVLSDGMGCGGRAAVDSAMAAGIAHRLWQADFAADAILQTVNAALLVKSREESLATLDVAVVDTHSGQLDLYKAGAAATLLRSGGRVSRLEHTGLPVGILPEVQFAHSRDTLSEGDILLMVSDGALCGGVAAVEELLAAHQGDMSTLAQAVVDAAVAAEEQRPDDVTVVALRLCRSDRAD